ncbi:MAG: nicotinamide mononucleotide transporter, partial [Marinilabiliaceae bacterium]|nr:nicotinamide mononucleotide transporter [Marinilabiliaceae bacterium]
MIDWLYAYGLEAAGLITSLVYLFYSIREKVWLWPWGILASLLSLWVFYSSRLYADMGLQVYYLSISVYGWWYWRSRSDKADESRVEVPIKKVRFILLIKVLAVGALMYGSILYALLFVPALLNIASSDMPYLDALTTAASIVATWMLAR